MLTAKDLPRCELSDFMEERLQKALLEERVARAKVLNCSVEDVPTAEGLCIRVVNNVVKLNEVKPQFADTFAAQGYPRAFEYKQKVLLLFQELEGVDMCLYCLYLQEYGDDAPKGNRRTGKPHFHIFNYFSDRSKNAFCVFDCHGSVTGSALRSHLLEGCT